MANQLWKMGMKRGIAYVEGKETADKVLQMTGRTVKQPETTRKNNPLRDQKDEALNGAMAVYTDKRGKPFAWQIPFDIRHWDDLSHLLQTQMT